MTSLFEQQMKSILRPFRKSLRPCMKRGIFTKANTRDCIVRLVNLSGQTLNLLKEIVRIVEDLSQKPVKRLISSSCPNIRRIWKNTLRIIRRLFGLNQDEMKCLIILSNQDSRIFVSRELRFHGEFQWILMKGMWYMFGWMPYQTILLQ